MPFSIKNLFGRKKSSARPVVLRSFHCRYPNAKHVVWQQVDVFQWQVNFVFKGRQYSALFNSQGRWLETVSIVTLETTPEAIKQKFEASYSRDGILQMHHIQSPHKNLYEMKWHNGIYVIKLLFDVTGKMVGRAVL